MLVLGIETTCDETAAAVVQRDDDGRGEILSNVVLSQVAEHAAYGGVVPEIAARAHVEILDHVIAKAMIDAELGLHELDGIAAAAGPGLIGGVIVGLDHRQGDRAGRREAADRGQSSRSARADGAAHRRGRVSLLPVPRLRRPHPDRRGAAASATMCVSAPPSTTPSAKPTTRSRSCSGWLIRADRRSSGRRCAAMPRRFMLPRPMLGRAEPDFSLSGLKTALRLEAEKIAPLSELDVADLCAGFQAAVVEVIADRVGAGLRLFYERFGDPTALVVAGGVAANRAIRAALERVACEASTALVAPPTELCTDNGAIIAWAGAERLALGLTDTLEASPRARWPLEELAAAGDRIVLCVSTGSPCWAPAHGARRLPMCWRAPDAPSRYGHATRRAPMRSRLRGKARGCRACDWNRGITVTSEIAEAVAGRRDPAGRAGAGVACRRDRRRPRVRARVPFGDRLRQGHRARHAPLHDRGDRASDAARACRRSCPGPSFATDVARGLPTAVTLAAADEATAAALAAALGSPHSGPITRPTCAASRSAARPRTCWRSRPASRPAAGSAPAPPPR